MSPKRFAMSFIQATVRGRLKLEQVGHNLRQELLDFINSPLEIGVEDPIAWWGVSASDISINSISNLSSY